MSSPAQQHSSPGTRLVRWLVGTILVAAALKLGRPVLVPLVMGIFFAVIARPLQQRVARAMPRRLGWLGVVVAVLAVITALAGVATAITFSGRAISNELRERRPRIEASLARMRASAEALGLPATMIPTLPRSGSGEAGAADGSAAPAPSSGTSAGSPTRRATGAAPQSSAGSPASSPQGAEGSRSGADGGGGGGEGGSGGGGGGEGGSGGGGVGRRVAAAIPAALGAILLAVGFCALALAEADEARDRLARAVPKRADGTVLDVVDEAVAAFRRYAWVKTLTSVLTGMTTWLACLTLGIPLAWVCGFLAFLLEYVPSVGSVLAIVPPVLIALAVEGPERALLAFFVVGALQVLMGNVIDPRLEGRLMHVSPFGVLLSIVVWGWLWGPAGALLAVPLTVAMVITARHVPGARGFAIFVTGRGKPSEEPGTDSQQ